MVAPLKTPAKSWRLWLCCSLVETFQPRMIPFPPSLATFCKRCHFATVPPDVYEPLPVEPSNWNVVELTTVIRTCRLRQCFHQPMRWSPRRQWKEPVSRRGDYNRRGVCSARQPRLSQRHPERRRWYQPVE